MARDAQEIEVFKERLRGMRPDMQLWHVNTEAGVDPAGFGAFKEGANGDWTLTVNMNGAFAVVVPAFDEEDDARAEAEARKSARLV